MSKVYQANLSAFPRYERNAPGRTGAGKTTKAHSVYKPKRHCSCGCGKCKG